MNLVIDQGNSLIKAGVFDKSRLIYSHSFEKTDEKSLGDLINRFAIDRWMVSSVRAEGEQLFAMLQQQMGGGIYFTHRTKLPFRNAYKTPETLGKDRLAAVAGAIVCFPFQNILVIDAGTAITYEMVTAEHVYLGGNIAPGMTMRFKALNHFTSKLPLCEPSNDFQLLGNSTQTAIVAGVQNSLIFEIDGYIDVLKKNYSDLKVILTGGDALFLEGKLKNSIFVEQNIVLQGLNHILIYNS